MRQWNIIDYDILGFPITSQEVMLAREQSRGHARRSGCGACLGVSFLGLLIGGGIAASGAGSQTPGPAIGAAAGAIALGIVALIGLLATGTVIAVTYSKDEADFLEMIKEARKPQAYGVRASVRLPDTPE